MSIKRRKRIIFSIFSVLVVLAMLISMILSSSAPLLAEELTSDNNTTTDYITHLSNDSSTRYAGRVWTDKSVYTGNATFTGDVGDQTIVKSKDADFLVAYSALATSQEIYGKAKACVDVVFVIDISGSMSNYNSYMDNGKKRIENLVEALNKSIDKVLSTNENSRVGVVGFSTDAVELLSLDHYTKRNGRNYFTLNNNVLNVSAINSSGIRVSKSQSVSGGTNTHVGLDSGMDILANAQNIETDGNNHVPALVLLSDGAATYSGQESTGYGWNQRYIGWWEPSGSTGDGSNTRDKHALKVAMNAQYMKQQVNNHYGVTDPEASNAMKVYTIGMGIEQLKGNEYYRAQLALDPGNHINDDNDPAKNILKAWNQYKNGQNPELDDYEFRHPSSNDINTIDYNDGYYSAENAEDVSNVFDDITNTITSVKPEAPTQIETGNPLESGYITFTDPLGKYMEVKDFNALIYGGNVFNQVSSSTSGDITTYTFTGDIESPVYGELDASSITIQVEKTADHQQTVKVEIPAAAIPLRVTTISLDSNGAVEDNDSNKAYPLRLLYSVGMEAGIDENLTGVDADYINANTVDGKVNFYSNLYSGNQQNGVTVGDATVEFTPSKTNPFYFIQEDTPLYTDKYGHTQATTFDESATYYLPVQYYEGTSFIKTYVARQGSKFKNYYKIENGQLFVTKGAPRLGNLSDFIKYKSDVVNTDNLNSLDNADSNPTNTAEAYYYPTFTGDVTTGSFVVYLGNNGVAQYSAPSSLTISKKVEAGDGLTAPDETFTFEVTMASKAGTTLKGVLNGNSSDLKNITFNADGKATITLKANDSLEILNVGKDVDYTIKEINLPEGFTSDKADNEVTGTTTATDAEVLFTNTYKVDPITSTELSLNLGGQKTITGRDFKAGDQFEFSIEAVQSIPNVPPAPLPQKDGQNVTTATINPTSGKQANFAFDGVITFTKPGTYQYSIKETNNKLPGIDYDTSVYRYSVTIKDNGLGELVLDGTPTIEKSVEGQIVSASEISFANNYSATDATVAISGMKVLNVTNSDLTLADNQFKFKIEALGSNEDGSDVFNTDNAQPMPVTTEVTNIANGNVVFGNMTFDQSMVGNTYGYKVTEVLPAGVTKDNPTLNGMTYDTSEKIVKVTVSTSSEGGEHVVATITPNDNSANFTFTNAYKPTEVTIGDATNAGIQVQKTFTGRNWTDDDKFEYTISSQTQNAPMPGNTKVTISKPVTGNVNSVQFGEMTFTKAGSYVYRISETKGSLGGVTYDSHTAEVTVNVTEDKATGTLSASIVYNNTNAVTDGDKAVTNAAAFTNIYKAIFDDATAINLTGKKVLNGKTLDEGNFYFIIEALNDAPLGNTQTLTPNSADGTIKLLQNIKYNTAGTYTYLISEQIPEQPQRGMTYDTSVYKVTVTVTDDQKGKLTAEITNIEKAANKDGQYNEVSSIEFTNNYQPLAATYTPVKVTKQLTGDRNTPLQADEFEFEMSVSSATPSDGIQLPGTTKVKNSADGTVQFGDITFTKVGTYIVEVKEVVPDPKAPGITYDGHVIRSTFKVTDDSGQLVVNRTGSTGTQTFNNRYLTTGTITGDTDLAITKVLNGRNWKDDDSFSFVLEGNNETTKQAIADGKVVLPANASGIDITGKMTNKKANFGDITFNAVGEYEFAVKEVIPQENEKIAGITYDTTIKLVKVKTTDNGDGTLAVNITENQLNSAFTNKYTPNETTLPGSENLKVTKEFTGRENNEWLDSDVFEFTIAGDPNDEATVNAIKDGNIVLTGTTATANKEHHEVNFGDITFKKAGTYKFIVQETKGNFDYITYDESVKTVVVNVTDNADGTLTATLDTTSDKLGFTNTYSVDPITLDGATNLNVTKVLTGRINDEWIAGDEFKFTLELTKGNEKNVTLPANAAGITITKDSVNKTANFGDITFKAPGEYEFEVKEVKGNIPNVTYDQSVKTIVVNVTDNKDGTLSANVDTEVSDKLEFTNEYKHGSVIVGDDNAIKVTKQLTGRANNEWLDSDSFTFKLTPSEETSKAVEDGLVVLPKNLEATATKANKIAVFNDIKFNEPGVYTFTVQEENGKLGGITYDENAYQVVVTVTDDQVGHLNATVTYGNNNDSSITVTNTYSTGTSTASYVIEGEKVLTGRNWHDDDVFTFVLSSDDENTLKAIENGTIVMPNTQTTVSGSDKEHKYAFDEIIFKEIGEYEFTVSEQKSDIKGITSDSHSAVVKVSVTDNNEGKIVAAGTTTQEGSLVFENTYKPVETPIAANQAIVINKTLAGRDMVDNEFKFTITPENGEPIVVNGKASKDGQAVAMDPYSAISFSEEGTKTFTVQEEKGKLGGITYDESVYQVTYEAKDNLHGEFDITRTITKDGKVVNDIQFMNTYHSNPVIVGPSGNAKLAGHKEIDNQDPNALFTMKGGEFNFEIKALGDNNAPLPANVSVQNDTEGNFVFGDIKFEQIGTYRYQISEVNNGLAGISYDAQTYDIEIKVTDDNKGQLQATVTGNNEIKFVNVYDPTDVSASINGTKTLTGRDMQAGEFTFILEAGDDATIEAIKNKNVVFKDNAQRLTTTNTEAGTINFGDSAITFKQAGTYTFNVSEETGTNDTITYDKNVYTVIAKVTDENGGLKVEWTNGDKIAFTNSYKPHPGSVEVPTVQKVLTGRELNAKEFTFTLSDVNGNVLKTVKNDKQGIVDFGTITFDEVGNYTYVIKETEGNAGGVTYDKSQYYVDIEVRDLDGQLTAVETVVYDSDRKPVDEIVFNNTYEAKSTEVMLGATKKLTGRELKAGEFTFILTDENGNKISQVHNDINGVVNFDTITYDKAGEYRYIISEVKGTDDSITYDSKQYNVIVKVTDNNKGNLEAKVEYPDGTPVFVNSCKPVSVQTGDNSQVGLWGALAGLSVIGLIKNRSSKKRKD